MWNLDSVRIYVQEFGDELGEIIPRIQPLDGPTILQIFGDESSIYKIQAKIVGYDDLDTIKGYVHDGATHNLLESPSGVSVPGYFDKDLYIRKMSYSRDKSIMQTMRNDLSCYAPVFTLDLELYEDET